MGLPQYPMSKGGELCVRFPESLVNLNRNWRYSLYPNMHSAPDTIDTSLFLEKGNLMTLIMIPIAYLNQ